MAREKLQRLIASLKEELGTSKSVDDDSKEMLQQLMQEIQDIAAGESTALDSQVTAIDQVETAAVKFESEHPKLSMILGEIVDTLGRLGI